MVANLRGELECAYFRNYSIRLSPLEDRMSFIRLKAILGS